MFDKPLHTVRGNAALDRSESAVGWLFSAAIICLGLSAVFGLWLERAGPRQAMAAAALCFGGGLLVAALGVRLHLDWLTLLGCGVLGGIGLGLGYISPVSTLIKWFPDRPDLATGLAIMGFGGAAVVGSPNEPRIAPRVPVARVEYQRRGRDVHRLGGGVRALYAVRGGTVRVPPRTEPGTPGRNSQNRRPRRYTPGGSGCCGRRATYAIFFAAGAAVYAALPPAPGVAAFVLGTGLLIGMYGGGFAAIPAYLRDRFGAAYMGAIHGRCSPRGTRRASRGRRS